MVRNRLVRRTQAGTSIIVCADLSIMSIGGKICAAPSLVLGRLRLRQSGQQSWQDKTPIFLQLQIFCFRYGPIRQRYMRLPAVITPLPGYKTICRYYCLLHFIPKLNLHFSQWASDPWDPLCICIFTLSSTAYGSITVPRIHSCPSAPFSTYTKSPRHRKTLRWSHLAVSPIESE